MSPSLPAYARELADARKRGLTLRNPTVSVALHGLRRPSIGYGVCVPEDKNPSSLDWTFCRDLEVIIFRRGDPLQRVIQAATAITGANPKRLVVVDSVDPSIAVIVRPDELEHARA